LMAEAEIAGVLTKVMVGTWQQAKVCRAHLQRPASG
jgi:hypothetical protein